MSGNEWAWARAPPNPGSTAIGRFLQPLLPDGRQAVALQATGTCRLVRLFGVRGRLYLHLHARAWRRLARPRCLNAATRWQPPRTPPSLPALARNPANNETWVNSRHRPSMPGDMAMRQTELHLTDEDRAAV